MEKLHAKGLTKNISSCDLDQKQLEKLMNLAKVSPLYFLLLVFVI